MLDLRNKKREQGLNSTRPRGFTLIELMITLAVAAIVFAIALPAFDDFVRNNRRAGAVNEFIAAANLARSEALRRASRMTLCRTNDPTNASPTCGAGGSGVGWEDGWIIFNDRNANPGDTVNVRDAGEEIIKVSQALGGDISIHGNSPVATHFGFRASGEYAGNNFGGSWVFCDSRGYDIQHVRELTINRQGRLRIKNLLPPINETGLGTCTP